MEVVPQPRRAVQIVLPDELNTYDVLVNDWLVFSKATLEAAVAASAQGERLRVAAEPDGESAENTEPSAEQAGDASEQQEPSRHHHPARRVGEVVRRVRRERLHVRRRRDANKIEIRQAIETIFGVRVTNVNTINRKGKRKRNRRSGTFGSRPDAKRAIVSLAEGPRVMTIPAE